MTCPHGMPTPASCLDCMEDGGLGAAPQERETAAGPAVTAACDGDCGLCHLGVHVGQRIVRTTRDRWVHAECLL